jgi:uncharacterized alpha/beta hydrolase family protein
MLEHIWRRFVKFVFLLPVLSTFLNGCAFIDLKKEVAEYKMSYGLVGKVTESSYRGPVIVILYSEKNGQKEIVKYTLTENTGHFSFIVTEGMYYLAAFEDPNYNFRHDAQELAGFYGEPDKIILSSDMMASTGSKSIKDLYIQLKQTDSFLPGFPAAMDAESYQGNSFVRLGYITDLNDRIFIQQNGSLGYWKPLTFLRDFGIGVYFIEPYDAAKIPILFVHGAAGTPVGWQKIVDQLDRQYYQPWFFYYPSGFRLDRIGGALNNIVKELHNEYPFDTLYVTVHSMGGLVSRSFILKNVYEDKQDYIKLLVSISTPWNGHRVSKKGVEQAPAVIPSWYDMVPDSEFIQSIHKRQLPPNIKYHLFFSFQGDCSMMMANNDGTVELVSELDYRAQEDAVRIYGFDENHMSILASQDVINQYNQILKSFKRGRGWHISDFVIQK